MIKKIVSFILLVCICTISCADADVKAKNKYYTKMLTITGDKKYHDSIMVVLEKYQKEHPLKK